MPSRGQSRQPPNGGLGDRAGQPFGARGGSQGAQNEPATRSARTARKMGHLTATGASPTEAFERAREAMACLGSTVEGEAPEHP